MLPKFATFLLGALGVTAVVNAYAGEYIPKSYYVISNGHKSAPVYLRSKRSIPDLLRKKRSSIPGVPSAEEFYQDAQEFLNGLSHGEFYFPHGFNPAVLQAGTGGGASGYGFGSGSGSGAYSFSSASASGGGPGSGGASGPQVRTYSGRPSDTNHYSNGSPHGPQVYTRSGEAQGNSIHVSGSASGPNGAYSSSSATADGNGHVRYSVRGGKY